MARTLSAEVSDAKTRPRRGAIVLARHGEPAVSRKVKLNAREYRAFWANYEITGLMPGQSPPSLLTGAVARCGILVASTRPRSVESAQALAAGRSFAQEAMLIEAPLPLADWPDWLRLSPKIWGFVARVFWWYFNYHADSESRSAAEIRAAQAADMLEMLAARGEDVVVLAHGFFNFMIGRVLKRRGWRLVHSEGWKYWSTRRFEPAG
jgi:hypothetical protein